MFSELENIYEPKKPPEIPKEVLDMTSNFLNLLGKDIMENDILEFYKYTCNSTIQRQINNCKINLASGQFKSKGEGLQGDSAKWSMKPLPL